MKPSRSAPRVGLFDLLGSGNLGKACHAFDGMCYGDRAPRTLPWDLVGGVTVDSGDWSATVSMSSLNCQRRQHGANA